MTGSERARVVLETERLVLRHLEPGDVDALHLVLGDPETMTYYPSAFSREKTTEWIEWNRSSYERYGFGLWGLVLRESGELIGDCGLISQDVDGASLIEIGWHVRRDLWGQGLATEAAVASRDHGFATLEVPRLISLVRPENVASCRVAEKIGMNVTGHTRRGPDWLHRVYGITRDEAARL